MPSKCPLCGASANIEFSNPAQDAPCPKCGHLLWASAQLADSIARHYANVLGTAPGEIDAGTQFSDLVADSLETVEWIMELEEEFGVSIPEEAAENFETIGDVVTYIREQRGKPS